MPEQMPSNQGVGATMVASRMHDQTLGKDGKPQITIFEHLLGIGLFWPLAIFCDELPFHGIFSQNISDCIDPAKIMAQFSGDHAIPGILSAFNPGYFKLLPFEFREPVTLDTILGMGKQADQERQQQHDQETQESEERHQQSEHTHEQEHQSKKQQHEHETAQQRDLVNEHGFGILFPGARMSRQMEQERRQRQYEEQSHKHHVEGGRQGQPHPQQQDMRSHYERLQQEKQYNQWLNRPGKKWGGG